MRHIHLLLIVLLLTTALSATQTTAPALAASMITVNSSNDDTIVDGKCTLREALTNANNNAATFPDCGSGSGADTIKFSSGLASPILINSSLPTLIDGSGVAIDGSGAKITINGNDTFRIFTIASGVPVTIKNLTLTSGYGMGGNIYNAGTLDIENSTIMNGNGLSGGAIYNDSGGTTVINNSTFTGNSALRGGVLYNNDGIVTINNATIYQNSVWSGGTGIIYNDSLTLVVKNTILAGGGGAEACGGIQLSDASANNLADDVSCGPSFTQVNDADLALGPLTDNGGSTPTFGLLDGSVAINAGNRCPPPNTDQRGFARPQGAACDIGAFEVKTSLTISPTTLSFGSEVIGAYTLPITVTITNTGEADIRIGTLVITTTGEFGLVDDQCSNQIIKPTANCTFGVVYSPLDDTTKTGKISIPNNTSTSTINISLTGTGMWGVNTLLNGNLNWPLNRPLGWKFAPYTIFSILDCRVSFSPNCSIRFKGTKNQTFTIAQGVQKSGNAGDRYLIMLTSKADSVPAGGIYRGTLTVYGPYKTPLVYTLDFSRGTHGWETAKSVITMPKIYYFYIFRISYRNTSGKVWFDNAYVIKLP